MAHTLSIDPASQRAPVDLTSDAVQQTRTELAACFQLAARFGMEEGICNHFSAMVPGHDDLFFVNPFGYAFREITPERLLVCDFDGHVIEGEGQPEATAFFIHASLHRAQPRVRMNLSVLNVASPNTSERRPDPIRRQNSICQNRS